MTEFIIKDQILIKYHGHAETVHIPSNVHTIGRRAFYKCISLVTLYLPPSVKIIETEAFYGCHYLKDIVFSDGNTSSRFLVLLFSGSRYLSPQYYGHRFPRF